MHASSERPEHLNDALELIDTAETALKRLQMLEPSQACASALDALSGERQRLQQRRGGSVPPEVPCVVRGAPLFEP